MANVSPRRRSRVAVGVGLVAIVALGALGLGALALRSPGEPLPVTAPPPSFPAPAPDTAVLIGAADIAGCGWEADEATAKLLDSLDGTVFLAGDTAYPNGSPEEFERCYDPGWGRQRDRTQFPAIGNHEYGTPGAAGYLAYFGRAAVPLGTTWYSAELGAWHVIVLNSDCGQVGCGEGSPQLEWLRGDLAASDARCTVAIWHHARFSSGQHGDTAAVADLWRALYEGGVDVALTGHDHDYERFAPQDAEGRADADRGIRQFVVGTGGAPLRDFKRPRPNSEVRDSRTHGVLRLELRPNDYAWDFVPANLSGFSDAGSGTCH